MYTFKSPTTKFSEYLPQLRRIAREFGLDIRNAREFRVIRQIFEHGTELN